jgi:hypothetical protein
LAAEIVDPKRHERAREREGKEIRNQLRGEWCGTHGVVGLHPDLELRALQGLHRQLHGGGSDSPVPGPEAPFPRRGARVLGGVGAARKRIPLAWGWRTGEEKRDRRGGVEWSGGRG